MATQGFKLEQLFGSKTRARLISLLLLHPEEAFFVRELTRKIDAQLNSVRRELKNLIELGIVVEKKGSDLSADAPLSEKKKYYQANTEFLLFTDLRSLFKKVHILLQQNLVHEIERYGTIDYLAFTGGFVDEPDVQTDIFLVGTVPDKKLEEIIATFEAEFSEEINYTRMTKDEYRYRQQVADRFLLSIMEGKKVVMVDRLTKAL